MQWLVLGPVSPAPVFSSQQHLQGCGRSLRVTLNWHTVEQSAMPHPRGGLWDSSASASSDAEGATQAGICGPYAQTMCFKAEGNPRPCCQTASFLPRPQPWVTSILLGRRVSNVLLWKDRD
ncbi:hypothetical protein KIL84_009062 [Mauremys mutica]|uniref:Uncharacterized protein n=1 Tax=Mauremys mutica TaxID=74926 RepID=A0A9D4B4I8_9SAUR|nr:hypothetical protein KIL84_009062 [Mauremys mutica]